MIEFKVCKNKEDTLQGNKYFAKLSKISDDCLKELGMVHENGINEGFEFKGNFNEIPTVGSSFYILDSEKLELFATSIVTDIIDSETFKTMNSTYSIKYLQKLEKSFG